MPPNARIALRFAACQFGKLSRPTLQVRAARNENDWLRIPPDGSGWVRLHQVAWLAIRCGRGRVVALKCFSMSRGDPRNHAIRFRRTFRRVWAVCRNGNGGEVASKEAGQSRRIPCLASAAKIPDIPNKHIKLRYIWFLGNRAKRTVLGIDPYEAVLPTTGRFEPKSQARNFPIHATLSLKRRFAAQTPSAEFAFQRNLWRTEREA